MNEIHTFFLDFSVIKLMTDLYSWQVNFLYDLQLPENKLIPAAIVFQR